MRRIQRRVNFDHKTCFPVLTIISVPMNPGQEEDEEAGSEGSSGIIANGNDCVR